MRDEYEPAAAERFAVEIDDGVLGGWRWRNSAQPPLLFCHATGFCASVYKQMLQPLQAEFDVFALDMRGHGRTALPANPKDLRSWDIYARDVAAFMDRQGQADWTLAGHSMGAVSVSMAAQGRKDVAVLRLIEPVAPPPALRVVARMPFWSLLSRRMPIAAQAARRRARWPSRKEVQVHYERKSLFRDWVPGVLSDYLEDGLIDDEEGVMLACAPAWEAATFRAQANDFWGAIRNVPASVDVLAADHPSTTAGAGARRRFQRMGARLTVWHGVDHLVPMQAPDRAARFIAEGC